MPLKPRQIIKEVIKYAPTQLTNSEFAKIKKFMGLRKDKDGRFYAYAITYSTKVFDRKTGTWIRKQKKEYYDTFIMIRPKTSTVVLSCSCPDFMYRHEVALYKRDAAEIEYSNGMRPRYTNPRMRWTCCKHCLRFFSFLNKKYPDIFPLDADLQRYID